MAELKTYAKPSHLYRYRPLGENLKRELEAIENSYIYCPNYSAMNDPMEGLHRLSSRFAENPKSGKHRVDVERTLENMGIASMSEVHDHEPMWAHYADQFRGMCVQYSLNRLLKGLEVDIAITRMMYSEIAPVLLDDNSNGIDRARLCLSSKTVRWASEREWRLFRKEKGQASYGSLKAATKIFLGSRICERDEKAVRRSAELLKIPVAKMKVDTYSISFLSKKIKRSNIL